MSNIEKPAWALLASATLTFALIAADASAQPTEQRTYELPGLTDDVRIAVDSAGVPHIYADSTADLFFAQGVNAARDRLFQLDLQRRQGLGELSEAFGAQYLEHDKAARTFMFRGDMDAEWESYGPGAREAAERFTEGVNAYVGLIEEHPEKAPPEFQELGYSPALWEPEDIVRIRSNSLGGNFTGEVTRSLFACAQDLDFGGVVTGSEPEHEVTIPDGLDPCSVSPDVLTPFILAVSPVSLGEEGAPAFDVQDETLRRMLEAEGSNSWTIAPERTSTGRPILAGDPHRSIQAPSLRYVVHLSGPEFDVIGAGEPFLPGISMGHNGTAAFGLTFLNADQQDLYVYDLDPQDSSRYRYGDGWETMTTVTEEIPTGEGDSEQVDLRFTRHGPVLHLDEESGTALALRSTWSEPGTAAYFHGMRLLDTEDFDDFEDSLSSWAGPPVNYTYADTDGDIGWATAGLIPRRDGHDGLLPVPGDGGYEWDGFLDPDDLPSSLNPEEGFLSTANERNVPLDLGIGYEWDPGYRQERIVEELEGRTSTTLTDSMALQNDHLDTSARDVLPLLDGLEAEGDVGAALRILREWDHVASRDSAGAALYQTWVSRHLGPTFYREVSPVLGETLTSTMNSGALYRALQEPERWLGEGAEEELERILTDSLGEAFADVSSSLGTDPDQWRWGSLHNTSFAHPWNPPIGPFERAGAEHTVDSSTFDAADHSQLSGASFRMVLDVGEWDSSVMVNAPGQSGDTRSPHYRDQVDDLLDGSYSPLLYTEGAVDEDTVLEIILRSDG